MSAYIFESKDLLEKWAENNKVPILHMETYYDHQDNNSLPQEYILREFAHLTHHIRPFYAYGDTVLTEQDRYMLTRIAGLYEVQGIGLESPPKEQVYFDFFRSGNASRAEYAHVLRDMMQALYTHFKNWELQNQFENLNLEEDSTHSYNMKFKKRQVAHGLTWLDEHYFKKD